MRDETYNVVVVGVVVCLITVAFWAGRLTATPKIVEKIIRPPVEQIYHLPEGADLGQICANLQAKAVSETEAYKTGWREGWHDSKAAKCRK